AQKTPHAAVDRRVPAVVGDGVEGAGTLRRLAESPRVLEVDRHRLLAQDANAARKRLKRGIEVEAVRGGDDEKIETGPEQPLAVGVVRNVEVAGEAPGPVRVGGGDADQTDSVAASPA